MFNTIQRKINAESQNMNEHGFIALSTVLIATLIIALAVTSITIQSIDESQVSVAYEKYKQSQYDTESCLEDVLFNLASDTNFNYSGQYFVDVNGFEIECEDVIVQQDAGTTTIEITAGTEFVNNLNVVIGTTTPSIIIQSYSTY